MQIDLLEITDQIFFFLINISKEVCMRTFSEYAKNFLFRIKEFWKSYFKSYKISSDIWFCIFTIRNSYLVIHHSLNHLIAYSMNKIK